ncbi:MAG: hypothetical protein CMJ31_02740 [Phycisphaerae bacterium]|nr:hypothetical protein [Phycisphaerae bacterium]
MQPASSHIWTAAAAGVTGVTATYAITHTSYEAVGIAGVAGGLLIATSAWAWREHARSTSQVVAPAALDDAEEPIAMQALSFDQRRAAELRPFERSRQVAALTNDPDSTDVIVDMAALLADRPGVVDIQSRRVGAGVDIDVRGKLTGETGVEIDRIFGRLSPLSDVDAAAPSSEESQSRSTRVFALHARADGDDELPKLAPVRAFFHDCRSCGARVQLLNLSIDRVTTAFDGVGLTSLGFPAGMRAGEVTRFINAWRQRFELGGWSFASPAM